MASRKTPAGRPDPLIDEVREIRRKLSEQFGGDIDRLCDYLAEIEAEHKERVVRAPEKGAAGRNRGD